MATIPSPTSNLTYCSSTQLTALQTTIAVLSTILGVSTLAFAIGLFLKAKKWKKAGAASRDTELSDVKRKLEHAEASLGSVARAAGGAQSWVGTRERWG